MKPTREQPFLIDDWMVAPAENVIHRLGTRVRLEPKAMDVLCHLAGHCGEVVSSGQILDRCWPGSCSSDSVVYKNIAILRKVLGERACGAKYIMTIPKRGYRLSAQVRVVPAGDAAAVDAEALGAAAVGAAAGDAGKDDLERALRILDRLGLDQVRSEDAPSFDPTLHRRSSQRLLRISTLLMEYVNGGAKLEASD